MLNCTRKGGGGSGWARNCHASGKSTVPAKFGADDLEVFAVSWSKNFQKLRKINWLRLSARFTRDSMRRTPDATSHEPEKTLEIHDMSFILCPLACAISFLPFLFWGLRTITSGVCPFFCVLPSSSPSHSSSWLPCLCLACCFLYRPSGVPRPVSSGSPPMSCILCHPFGVQSHVQDPVSRAQC